ncbi:hypothetical protein EYC58_00230 [Candidatus Saccharibacteria bacterium]|nr:MAG: hypothetical protein EYC58_00230 [Candidatus Saccharibacteria bacterium]
MKKNNFKHLVGIKITYNNCDEIQNEAMQLFMLAMRVSSAKIYSQHMSERVKRGLQARKERLAIQEQSR